MLHEKLHIDDPRCFDTAVTVPDDPAVLDEVARLLSFTVYRVLGKRLQPTDARRALTDTKTMRGCCETQTEARPGSWAA